ncbi:hypothetical protein BJ322DRAFT_1114998 [Thelephora terrestris]|uniref:Uncharacterized protein n=1 Tax=Thelephora terrestris TaxID=56493 RepID=A0A9P6H412_9AGAM|nr:hypothetical protein BJ322DRAFT_1114998 [Thelephora terrestris]
MMTATDSVSSRDGGIKQQRRQTVSTYLPPTPLDLPQPGDARSEDGSDQEDHDDAHESWGERPQSPASSVTKFAAHFAQRVGSFMNSSPAVGSVSSLPSEAEIEAEAERERERGRREAERILAMERMKAADDRMTVEQRVLAMLQSDQARTAPIPIPSHPQQPTTPSPSTSQKEASGWWTAARNKLTPTKDPLTPAQQIIQDAKYREKEKEKERKAQKKDRRNKSKDSEKDWPASPERKYSDPTYMKLNVPQTPVTVQQVQQRSSSSSPAPLRHSTPPSLAASPLRGADSKDSSPLYAQFSSDGDLDVHSTLLTVARRFEKLEKWTVSHVRALEERMDDVERWLVDKEKEKEPQSQQRGRQSSGSLDVTQDISDIREEMTELQGRMSEIGREMAKLATSPSHLSNAPSRSHVIHKSSFSEIAVRSMTTSPTHSYPTASGQEPTSPPSIAPLVPTSTGSRTRLPYPTGDYATPPDTVILAQGHFSSPPNSPPSSTLSNSVTKQLSGLPTGLDTPVSNVSGLPGHTSPLSGLSPQPKVTPSPSLPPPKKNEYRHSSVSPTPRKRYTVALGGPIVDPDRLRNSPSPIEQPSSSAMLYSSATDEESDDFQEETVGKSSGRRVNMSSLDDGDSIRPVSKEVSKEPARVGRPRPQSTYGQPTAPLMPRVRSRSTAGTGLGMNGDLNGSNTSLNKFVDPLVVRKQEKEKQSQQKAELTKPMAVRAGGRKKAVKDLAAFFDGGEK